MREKIACACGTEIGRISVKATTEEGLGFTGNMEGVAAPCGLPAGRAFSAENTTCRKKNNFQKTVIEFIAGCGTIELYLCAILESRGETA